MSGLVGRPERQRKKAGQEQGDDESRKHQQGHAAPGCLYRPLVHRDQHSLGMRRNRDGVAQGRMPQVTFAPLIAPTRAPGHGRRIIGEAMRPRLEESARAREVLDDIIPVS